MKSRIADGGLKVFDLYQFSICRPDHRCSASFRARDGARRLVRREIRKPSWARTKTGRARRDNFGREPPTLAAQVLPHLHRSNLPSSVRSRPWPQTVRLITEAKRDGGHLRRTRCIFARARGEARPTLRRSTRSTFPYAQISDGLLEPGEPNPALFGKLGLGTARDCRGTAHLPFGRALSCRPAARHFR